MVARSARTAAESDAPKGTSSVRQSRASVAALRAAESGDPKGYVLSAAGADAPKGTSPVRQKVHRKGCDDESMRWLVELEASREDIERLLAESPEGLFATEDPLVALLEILDPEHENNTDEARAVGRTLIDAAVRRWNGFGKLRWGRSQGPGKVTS